MKTAPRRLWIILAVLSFAGILRATLPQITIGKWTATNALSQARSNSAAVMLSDGSILLSGGDSGSGALQSAEIFGVNGNISSSPAMNVARSGHFAVVLSDGRVLVGGGNTTGGGTTNSAEIYDPNANTWTQTSPMTSARANATAALLQDGRVLIAGGDNAGAPSNTIEIYDPASGNFSFAGTLSSPRTQHAMAVLQDGRVLIVGGFDGNNPLASSDIYDPASGNISAGPSLATARYAASATTLMNGQVAVIGGAGQGSNGAVDLASIEVFDPTSGVFTNAGVSLTTARQGHQAFLLPNNNSVLIVSGTSAATALASAELFTAQVSTADGSWSYIVSVTGSMTTARASASGSANQANGPTSTVTPKSGLVILGGGSDASGTTLSSTEAYGYPTVQTDQGDYPPGSTVNVQGSGFKPGESVSITLVESPLIDTHGPYTVVADGNGNFSDSSFATDIHDVNVRFWLSAVGSQSGSVAENTFTDGNATSVSGTVKSSAAGNPAIVGATITCTSGCNNSPAATTTSGAGGAYVFDNGTTKLSFNTNGPVTLQLTATAPGFNPSTITLSNVNNGAQLTNENFTLTPSVVGTTTTVVTSGTPSVYGSSVTVTATVTRASGNNTPTGTVAIKDGVTTICTTANLSGSASSPSASCSVASLSVAGSPHSITAVYGGDTNFTGSTSSAISQTVTPKALTYSGLTVPASRTYDGTTSAVVSGSASLQPAEALGTGTSTDGKPYTADAVTLTGTTTATYNSKDVATAATVTFSGISLSGADGTNYTLTAATQAATITPKALTYTGLTVPVSRIYDGTTAAVVSGTAMLHATEAAGTGTTADGIPYGVDSVNLTGTPTATYNTKDVLTANIVTFGGVPLTGTGHGNYTLTSLTQAATITPKALAYSGVSVPASKPYDGTTNAVVSGSPTLQTAESIGTGSSADGKPYTGDTVSVTGAITATYNSQNVSAANLVTFAGAMLTGSDSGDYTLTALTQAATITPATLTYTANPATRSYGASDPAFSGAVTGFVSAETQATATTGSLAFTTTATAFSNVGNYPINGSGLTANYGNYVFVQAAGNATALSITKAHLAVKADDQSQTYNGLAFSGFTATLSGFVNGETDAGLRVSSALSGAAGFTGAATTAVNAGTYAITPIVGSLTATNYDFTTFVDGTLVINKVHLTVKADDQMKNYDGSAFTAFTVSFTGFVNNENGSVVSGAASFSGNAVGSVNAGIYTITPAQGSLTATNYDFTSFLNGALTINKVHLTVKADDKLKTYDGSAFTAFTTTLTGFVNGENSSVVAGAPSFSGNAVGAVNAGMYTITPMQGSLTATNYDFTSFLNGTLTISKADTSTTVNSSQNPSVFGQAVTFTATITNASGTVATPTGTVQFVVDGINFGAPVALIAGSATSGPTSALSVSGSPHSVTVNYTNVDGNFNDSMGTLGGGQAVNKANTTTAITSDAPDPSVVGQPVTVSYSVTVQAPGSGTPTGNVTVSDGTVSCTSTIAAGNCMLTFTTAGPKTLTATYAGDANFNGGSSVSEPHTVNKASTTTAIVSENPSASSVVGQLVTVSYTVTVNSPGSGTPTGTVTVSDGTVSCTASISAGSCMLTFTSAGARNLAATYAGDSNFLGSVSASAPYMVNKADTTTKINSISPEPSLVGQSVTINYGVTVNAPGSGTPTGNVTVTDGTVSCTASVAAGSCSLTFNSVGSKTLTATYAGDTNFNMSASAGVSHSVQYKVCLLYDPTRAVKSGATYPLKMYLCDVNSNDVSSAAIVVHATSIFMSSTFTGTPEDSGNANPDNDFRFDSTLGPSGGYIFNLQTKGLTGGTYGFSFTAGTDPTTHSVSPGFGVK